MALGATGAAWGAGAALSNFVAGYIANAAGFNAAFLFLAAIAALAFLTFWLFVPETRSRSAEVEHAASTKRSPNDAKGAG